MFCLENVSVKLLNLLSAFTVITTVFCCITTHTSHVRLHFTHYTLDPLFPLPVFFSCTKYAFYIISWGDGSPSGKWILEVYDATDVTDWTVWGIFPFMDIMFPSLVFALLTVLLLASSASSPILVLTYLLLLLQSLWQISFKGKPVMRATEEAICPPWFDVSFCWGKRDVFRGYTWFSVHGLACNIPEVKWTSYLFCCFFLQKWHQFLYHHQCHFVWPLLLW